MLRAGKTVVSSAGLGLESTERGPIFLFKISKKDSVHGPCRSTQEACGVMPAALSPRGHHGGKGTRAA